MDDQSPCIHDWDDGESQLMQPFELLDETLRDGLQSPSVTDPSLDEKRQLLALMANLGIQNVNLGIPGASSRAYAHALALAAELQRAKLPLRAHCAARTRLDDVQPIADIVQRTGAELEAYTFIGSSPIRMLAETWSVDFLLRHIETAVSFAVRQQLPACLVLEDASRSRPEILERLFRCAVHLGVQRICLCDTVGCATLSGVTRLITWSRRLLHRLDAPHVGLDWHGHNDRGFALSNAWAALRAGAGRVHGTALGLGERVGNVPIDQLLVNLKLAGAWPHDLAALSRYCEAVAQACEVQIPANYPVLGQDAFRTGTGVHASAIMKAKKSEWPRLADQVYSAVPAHLFGRQQEIEIGHMSGVSNVIYWLERRQIHYDASMVRAIYATAKQATRLLLESEVWAVVQRCQGV